MPARNGVATPGFRRLMASETDHDPAEWPYNAKVSYGVISRIYWGPHVP